MSKFRINGIRYARPELLEQLPDVFKPQDEWTLTIREGRNQVRLNPRRALKFTDLATLATLFQTNLIDIMGCEEGYYGEHDESWVRVALISSLRDKFFSSELISQQRIDTWNEKEKLRSEQSYRDKIRNEAVKLGLLKD